MQCILKPIDYLLIGKSVEPSTHNEHCIIETCKHRSSTNLTGAVNNKVPANRSLQVSPHSSPCGGSPAQDGV